MDYATIEVRRTWRFARSSFSSAETSEARSAISGWRGEWCKLWGKREMARIRTEPWDLADYLKTPRDIAGYLEAVLEDGDPALVAAALGDVARAKGMGQIAKEAGLGRESLYKALSKDGNPELATILRVIKALGLRLRAVPVK